MLFQKRDITTSLVSKMEIISNDNHLCTDISHKYIPHKIFRHHMRCLLGKGILDQYIDPHFFHNAKPLFFCINQRLFLSGQQTHRMKVKSKDNGLKTLFAIFF